MARLNENKDEVQCAAEMENHVAEKMDEDKAHEQGKCGAGLPRILLMLTAVYSFHYTNPEKK